MCDVGKRLYLSMRSGGIRKLLLICMEGPCVFLGPAFLCGA